MAKLGRRKFMGAAGLVAAAAGCRPRPDPYAPVKPEVPLPPNLRAGSETQVLSTCGLCAAGCGIRVRVVEGRAVKIEGNPRSPVNRGRLCARGQAALELLYHPDRVRGPMRRAGARGGNDWLPLSWDAAIAQLAGELGKLRAAGEPQAVVLLDGESRGATHALWARFLRAFGSPNHVGHGATGAGATLRAMAAMTGVASLPGYDFANARLALLVGTGALEASPQVMHLARALARGSRPRLLCAWPRLPRGAAVVDEWLPLAPGGAAALLLALAHVLLREGLADESGLQTVPGFAGEAPALAAGGLRHRIEAEFSPRQLAAQTGLAASRLERLARELAATRPSLVAVDESTADDATAAAGLVVNALLGNLDAVGGLRLDAGWEQPAWEAPALDPTAEAGLRRGPLDGRQASPTDFASSRVLALPEAVLAEQPYAAKLLLLYRSNPAYAKPGRRWWQALDKLPLVVSFSPLLDESARFADLVLPDHTFLERWDVVAPGRGTRALSFRQAVVRPVRDTRQTGEVILQLAAAMGGTMAEAFPWRTYAEAVRSGLLRLPGGAGDALAALEREGVWCAQSDADARRADGAGGFGVFADVGRTIPDAGPTAEGDPARFPFVLVPFRGPGYAEGGMRHLPWLGEMPLAASAPGQLAIEISPADAATLGIAAGDVVRVESPRARLTMLARVSEYVRAGTLGLPLGGGGWPVAGAEDNPLRLLADLVDARTGQWRVCGTRAWVGRAG
jgi:anaerobic selenocysteine-containing dehydrogenase